MLYSVLVTCSQAKNTCSRDRVPSHGGRRRHEIRQGSNNFLSLVRNITKLPHRMEFDIPENPMFFVFRYCYILAGK